MPFPDFDPVLLQIGPFAIRWYALAYVAGILVGWRYVAGLIKNQALWGPRGALGPTAWSVGGLLRGASRGRSGLDSP